MVDKKKVTPADYDRWGKMGIVVTKKPQQTKKKVKKGK